MIEEQDNPTGKIMARRAAPAQMERTLTDLEIIELESDFDDLRENVLAGDGSDDVIEQELSVDVDVDVSEDEEVITADSVYGSEYDTPEEVDTSPHLDSTDNLEPKGDRGRTGNKVKKTVPSSTAETARALRAPLYGRNEQLNELKEVFLSTWNDRRLSLVTLLGEPGSGKTRVAREFARSVRAAIPNALVLWGVATDPEGAAYEAISGALSERFGIGQTEAPEDVREKIAASVGETLPAPLCEEVTHLIAHLMGAPFPESPVIDTLARELRDLDMRCQIAVRRFLEQHADRGPLVLCLDNMENARVETISLVNYLAQSMQDRPVMILTAACPELVERYPQWGHGEMGHHRIDLEQMERDDVGLLLRSLIGVQQIPDELVDVACDRLHGSPRAIYDLARFLIETRAVEGDERNGSISAKRLKEIELPAAHEDLLRQRLQALPRGEQQLLIQASAVGDVFWTGAVVALARAVAVSPEQPDGPPLDEIGALVVRTTSEVAAALAALCQRGLIVEASASTLAGEQEYRFAYPPIQRLAYSMFRRTDEEQQGLSRDCLRCHSLVAQWLDLRPEGRLEKRQEQVAEQLERAGDRLGAANRYRRAANCARDRFRGDKAARLYRQALACLGETDLGTRLYIWHDLGSVYQAIGDLDAALDVFERMLRLSWVVASRPKAAVAYNKLGRLWRQKGNPRLALEHLQRGLRMYRESGDDRGVASSLDDIARVHWMQGKQETALDLSAKALEMRRRLGDKRSMAVSLATIGNIEKDRGLFEEAEACLRQALQLREETTDRPGHAESLTDLGELDFARGRLADARQHWETALCDTDRIGAGPIQMRVLSNLGSLAVRQGQINDAHEYLSRALDAANDTDDQRSRIETLHTMGLAELADGNSSRAKSTAEEALVLAQESELAPLAAKAEMVLAEIHAATIFDASASDTSSPSGADLHFARAIQIFRDCSHDLQLARALRRLGEYRIERGQWDSGKAALQEAKDILARLDLPEADEIERMMRELGA